MGQGPFVGRNGLSANNTLTVGNNTIVFITGNSTGLFVGSNTALQNDGLYVGNSTVNVYSNSSLLSVGGVANVTANGFQVGVITINATAINLGTAVIDSTLGITVGNSTVNSFANSTIFKIGIITSNTTAIGVGSNVFMDFASVQLGNSTVNAIANQFGFTVGTTVVNSSIMQIGANVFLSPSGLFVGNSSVNTSISATGVAVNGVNLLPATIDLGFVIGDGTNVIANGATGRILGPFDYSGTIVGWSILGQESGTVSIDVLKCTYSQYDAGGTHPVAADKISASAPITMTAATKNQSATLTGWTTNFAAQDILAFNVTAATTSKQVLIFLKVLKTS